MGLSPSLFWLLFYLKKDLRPEPKYLVSKTFAMGIIVAPLAVIAQWSVRSTALYFNSAYDASSSVVFFTLAALIEEVVKFLAVRFVVLRDSEFDEPLDAMVYMVVAGLGFAAIENLLILFQTIPSGIDSTIQILLLRFAGATLLHAVSSAAVGYFLALAWFYSHHCAKIITAGLGVGTVIHLVFNLILLGSKGKPEGFIISTIFLFISAFMISSLFRKLKKREVADLIRAGVHN